MTCQKLNQKRVAELGVGCTFLDAIIPVVAINPLSIPSTLHRPLTRRIYSKELSVLALRLQLGQQEKGKKRLCERKT